MFNYFYVIIGIGLISLGCNSKKIKTGIYNQGFYISEKNDRINTFYIYDFVSDETIKKHAMNSVYSIGSITENYYFSYNANIPSQDLVSAESLSEAKKLINDYSYGIKYAFNRSNSGDIIFVNCAISPQHHLCTPD